MVVTKNRKYKCLISAAGFKEDKIYQCSSDGLLVNDYNIQYQMEEWSNKIFKEI